MFGLLQTCIELALLGSLAENRLEQTNEMKGRHTYFSGHLPNRERVLFCFTQELSRMAEPDQYVFVEHTSSMYA